MYVIRVLNGYVTRKGTRTANVHQAKQYDNKASAKKIAYVCGGRLEQVE